MPSSPRKTSPPKQLPSGAAIARSSTPGICPSMPLVVAAPPWIAAPEPAYTPRPGPSSLGYVVSIALLLTPQALFAQASPDSTPPGPPWSGTFTARVDGQERAWAIEIEELGQQSLVRVRADGATFRRLEVASMNDRSTFTVSSRTERHCNGPGEYLIAGDSESFEFVSVGDPCTTRKGFLEGLGRLRRHTSRHLVASFSGGASLGAYQAGMAAGLLVQLRELRDHADQPAYPLTTLAGTSAGGINSLLFAIDWCTRSPFILSKSSLYQTWLRLGFHSLLERREYSKNQPNGSGLLSRTNLEELVLADLGRAINAAPSESCRKSPLTLLAAPLTGTRGRRFDVGGLDVTSYRTISVYGIDWYRKERVVNPGNLLPTHTYGNADVLYPSADSDSRWPLAIAQATSAVPVVFPPVPINDRWFWDGGVFDNHPIALGLGLELDRLDRPAGLPLAIAFLHPGRVRTLGPSEEPEPDELSGVMAIKRLFNDVGGSARTISLLESMGALEGQLDFTVPMSFGTNSRSVPVYGDSFASFGAFLARPLRIHDFYVGVYGGLVLGAEILCTQDRNRLGHSSEDCKSTTVLSGVQRTAWGDGVDIASALSGIEDLPAEGQTPNRRLMSILHEALVAFDTITSGRDLLCTDIGGPYCPNPEGPPPQPAWCPEVGPVSRRVCADPLTKALSHVHDRRKAWYPSADSVCPGPECLADAEFLAVLEDPLGQIVSVGEDLLRQLWRLEQVKPDSISHEKTAEWVEMFFAIGERELLRDWALRLSPSSVPDRERASLRGLTSLLPLQGFSRTTSSGRMWSLRYRPTLYLGRPFRWQCCGRLLLGVPITFEDLRSPDINVGGSVVYRTGRLIMPEFEFAAWRLGGDHKSIDLLSSWLGGKALLGARWSSSYGWSMLVGTGDLPGTLYWAFRGALAP